MCSKKVAKGAQKWYEHPSFLNSVVQKSDLNISFFRDLGGLNLILFIWNVLFFSIFFQQKFLNDRIPNSDGFRVTFRWELSRAFLSQHRLKPPVAIASWQKIVQPFTVPPGVGWDFFFQGTSKNWGCSCFFLCFLRIVPWDGKSSPSNHDLSNPREMAQKNQRDEILCRNWIQIVGLFLELWWQVFYSCSSWKWHKFIFIFIYIYIYLCTHTLNFYIFLGPMFCWTLILKGFPRKCLDVVSGHDS